MREVGRRPSGLETPGWLPTEFDWVVGCSYTGLPETVAPVRNLIGAAMSFRRYLFDEIGTFDTEMGRLGVLPLGCEETEFAIRVRLNVAGAEILHVPSAIVRHHIEPERVRVRYFLHRCYAEGLSKAAVAAEVALEQPLPPSAVTSSQLFREVSCWGSTTVFGAT